MENLCNDVIKHLEDKLCLHPFYKQNGVNAKEMVEQFRDSDIIQNFQRSKDFNFDDLAEFAYALVRKDNTLLI